MASHFGFRPALGPRDWALIDRGCRLQINLFPLSLDDSGADLRSRLALLVLLVRVVKFLQARRTPSSVSILEAAVQAVVSHAVAITVTGLLMNHVGDLSRKLVGMSLV